MGILNTIIGYIFSFEAYVLLPIIIFIISLIFRISLKKAFRSCDYYWNWLYRYLYGPGLFC